MILTAAMLYLRGSFLVHHTILFDYVLRECGHCVDIWLRRFTFKRCIEHLILIISECGHCVDIRFRPFPFIRCIEHLILIISECGHCVDIWFRPFPFIRCIEHLDIVISEVKCFMIHKLGIAQCGDLSKLSNIKRNSMV